MYLSRAGEISIARKEYYSKNRDRILELAKNKYATDQGYRKAKIDQVKQRIKERYGNNEEQRNIHKKAARTYRRRQKDYFLELERQVIANIDLLAENIRAESITEDAIDIFRERESFQSKNISGAETLKPLDLSTRSQTGRSSFSSTLTFEEDAIDILREREAFQTKSISGDEILEPLDLSTRSQAGSSFSNTPIFEEVKTGVTEPNSISALQESTNNLGIMRSIIQGGNSVECFDRYSLKPKPNFKELEPKNILVTQEEIPLKKVTQRSCHRNSCGRLSASEKEAKSKELNRIAAKKYRMNKKLKLQELEETILKLETLQRGETLQ
jgi:hypothetical protein